jgi:hypothetical protein
MFKMKFLAISFLACAIGSAPVTKDHTEARAELAKEEAIREAIIRYQIKTWELNADTFCIEVNRKNPRQELLERLTLLPVKRLTQCKKKNVVVGMMQVVDRASGKQSVIFGTGELHWITKTEVDVEGGYLCASMCGGSGTYLLELEGTQWVVKKFDIHMMM